MSAEDEEARLNAWFLLAQQQREASLAGAFSPSRTDEYSLQKTPNAALTAMPRPFLLPPPASGCSSS